MSYADVLDVDHRRREVPLQQIGHLLGGRIRHGGLDAAFSPVPGDPGTAHHPRDPLVVDPLIVGHTVVELGGDPRRPVGVVLVVHRADTVGQRLISSGLRGAGIGAGQPRVER